MLEGSCDIVHVHIVPVTTFNVKKFEKKNIGFMDYLNLVVTSSRELFQDTFLEIKIVV